jgi:hypothetical protein
MRTTMTLALVMHATGTVGLTRLAIAQRPDSAQPHIVVRSALTVTNKGISVIPTFTLGKPAAIADLVVAKGKASFEPQFRMGLDGKPWSFIFWARYALLEREHFRLAVGAHPSIVFRTAPITINGASRNAIVGRRYLATELAPTVVLSPRVTVGLYHLFSRALESDVARWTNYLALRGALTTVPLGAGFTLRLDPQAYWLRLGATSGTYVNGAVTIARRGAPWSVSASENRALDTHITGERVLWNVSATWAFR